MTDPTTTEETVTEPVEAPETDETTEETREEPPEAPEGTQQPEEQPEEEEPETFPRSYVEKLRKENAGYRERAQRADDLAAALWTSRVSATGRLADPTDLPMPEQADPLDAEAVTAAVDDLLTRKPHLAARRVTGDVGQGVSGRSATVDLAGILRSRAS
ncbi:hypothetical protein [Segeticoccus rhizosphaerae]|uniref:hypothetical protein n=1 Tax=Segeticoccus rhizosphaerae TaxID=1104777 RepID=UPI0010C07A48|nr:hypothetical protein [Ornithinicoccus soli]